MTVEKSDKVAAAKQQAVEAAMANAMAFTTRNFARMQAAVYDYRRGIFTVDELVKLSEFYVAQAAKCLEQTKHLETGLIEPSYLASVTNYCPVCGEASPDFLVPCKCELDSGLNLPSPRAMLAIEVELLETDLDAIPY